MDLTHTVSQSLLATLQNDAARSREMHRVRVKIYGKKPSRKEGKSVLVLVRSARHLAAEEDIAEQYERDLNDSVNGMMTLYGRVLGRDRAMQKAFERMFTLYPHYDRVGICNDIGGFKKKRLPICQDADDIDDARYKQFLINEKGEEAQQRYQAIHDKFIKAMEAIGKENQ